MSPKGKTPSLIGGGAGASKIVVALKKRTCRRCKSAIPANSNCIEVAIPGSFGHKTYCIDCFMGILEQSREDLQRLEDSVTSL
jgi:hypothetical protein